MRIALTGSHRTGKSTLAAGLARASPSLLPANEPYYHLKRQGYKFADSLSLEDFVKQLELSIHMLSERARSVVFDRCPIDFVGYIACHPDTRHFDFGAWIPRVQESVKTLDLIVRVPIEDPDRIDAVFSDEERHARTVVDKAIQDLLTSRVFTELGIDIITVNGSVDDRVREVLRVADGGGLGV